MARVFFHLGIFAQADLAPASGLSGMWLDKRYLILLMIQSLSRLGVRYDPVQPEHAREVFWKFLENALAGLMFRRNLFSQQCGGRQMTFPTLPSRPEPREAILSNKGYPGKEQHRQVSCDSDVTGSSQPAAFILTPTTTTNAPP